MALSSSSRQLMKSYIFMMRPFTEISALRSLSTSAIRLADKPASDNAKKGANPPEPPAMPPPKAATTPPQPATPPTTSKGDTYQATDIFSYNKMSFYDLESAMRKSRLPQPQPGTPSD